MRRREKEEGKGREGKKSRHRKVIEISQSHTPSNLSRFTSEMEIKIKSYN